MLHMASVHAVLEYASCCAQAAVAAIVCLCPFGLQGALPTALGLITMRPFLQVTIHPFDDGNGRLCRLLADHVLSAVFPCPIPALLDDSQRRRGVYVEALNNTLDLSDPKLTRAKPPSDYAALLIECAWLCWQEARQELNRYKHVLSRHMHACALNPTLWSCLLLKLLLHRRCKELANLRGKLFGNEFDHQRYLTLVNINLSPKEQEHETDTICKCIQERQVVSNHLSTEQRSSKFP